MALTALAASPLDLFDAVVLRDPAVDLETMAAAHHDPPQEMALSQGGAATWTRLMEYSTRREAALLHYLPGEAPTVFRLGRLSLAQAQAVRDEPGEGSRAVLAVRYALRSVAGYTLGDGRPLVVERERGPCGEWATWATMERIDLAHIEDLAATVLVRSGLTVPFRPTLRPRCESSPASTSEPLSTPSAA